MDDKDIAPIICGTVVNGQFERKLRMLRADIFCMLSVCNSIQFVKGMKVHRHIREGLLGMVKRTQDINSADECIPFMKNWDKGLIQDKCLRNQAIDITTVNFPDHFEARRLVEMNQATKEQEVLAKRFSELKKVSSTCSTYVYAAYLPPGLHQFLIYCPVMKKLYVKDVFIDLSNLRYFPEYPREFPKPEKVKTNSNVWRKWREDSEIDITFARTADMVEVSYKPELFLKDDIDISRCG